MDRDPTILDDIDVNYYHEIHDRGRIRNFWLRQHSTSHIEGIWHTIK